MTTHRYILALGMSLITCVLLAQGRDEIPFWKKPLLYDSTGLREKTEVLRNINYTQGASAITVFDLYRPATATQSPLPVVIFVHGGPVPEEAKPKDWRVFRDYGKLAARNGFIGVTFNHRFHRHQDLETAAGDIRSLMVYLRENAGKYNVDVSRTGVWLFSFGGAFLPLFTKEPPVNVRAIASYYGFLEPAHDPELVKSMAAEKIAAYSATGAMNDLRKKDIHLQIVRCGNDFDRIRTGTDEFLQKAFADDLDFELVNYAGAVHGFDLADDNQTTRETIRSTTDFFKRTLVLK